MNHWDSCKFFMVPLEQSPPSEPQPASTAKEREAERRRLRRLQIMVGMVISVLSQDSDLTLAQARKMAADCREAALDMFPGKELAFDLIYRPRLERVIKERFEGGQG
jgi:hypothetical protein